MLDAFFDNIIISKNCLNNIYYNIFLFKQYIYIEKTCNSSSTRKHLVFNFNNNVIFIFNYLIVVKFFRNVNYVNKKISL